MSASTFDDVSPHGTIENCRTVVGFLRHTLVPEPVDGTLQLNDEDTIGLQLILKGVHDALENAAEGLRGTPS